MPTQETLKAFIANKATEIDFKLMRPLTERFKPDMVYRCPLVGGSIPFQIINPNNAPLTEFTDVSVQFEYNAITPALDFLNKNHNVYAVSIPMQMKVNANFHGELRILNSTFDIFISEGIINGKTEIVPHFSFSFTTLHDNVTYTYFIDPQDFLNQVLAATQHKEFQG